VEIPERPSARPVRPPMTADEAKALGHPTRLRIVFACRDRAMTNKELAAALGTTPGTIHYHLRPLVAQGFLVPLEPRPGPRGSREQPYRSTGRSWELAGSDQTIHALRTVAVDELLTAADEQVVELTRLGLTLTRRERDELVHSLGAVLEAAFARSRDREGARDREGPREPAQDGPLDEVTVLLAVTVGNPGSGTTG
jgi:DNA-binding transcriptional ArsR family regulator